MPPFLVSSFCLATWLLPYHTHFTLAPIVAPWLQYYRPSFLTSNIHCCVGLTLAKAILLFPFLLFLFLLTSS